MPVLELKGRAFLEKVNSRCFCWFPAAILVDQNGTPIWRLHTKLYKGAWNVSANNSETVGHKNLKLGQIVYILVFYNFHFLGFFHWTVSNLFFVAWQWKRSISSRIFENVIAKWTFCVSIVAIIKTKSVTVAYFSSPPFFLLRYCDFGASRA